MGDVQFCWSLFRRRQRCFELHEFLMTMVYLCSVHCTLLSMDPRVQCTIPTKNTQKNRYICSLFVSSCHVRAQDDAMLKDSGFLATNNVIQASNTNAFCRGVSISISTVCYFKDIIDALLSRFQFHEHLWIAWQCPLENVLFSCVYMSEMGDFICWDDPDQATKWLTLFLLLLLLFRINARPFCVSIHIKSTATNRISRKNGTQIPS